GSSDLASPGRTARRRAGAVCRDGRRASCLRASCAGREGLPESGPRPAHRAAVTGRGIGAGASEGDGAVVACPSGGLVRVLSAWRDDAGAGQPVVGLRGWCAGRAGGSGHVGGSTGQAVTIITETRRRALGVCLSRVSAASRPDTHLVIRSWFA